MAHEAKTRNQLYVHICENNGLCAAAGNVREHIMLNVMMKNKLCLCRSAALNGGG